MKGEFIMQVKIKGEQFELVGEQVKVGQKAPDFALVNLKKQIVQLSDLNDKPVIISVVPDIDTRICQLQTKRFNQEAAAVKEIHFLTISNNTKEEQEQWCSAEGVDMEMLHDTENKFGELYGLYIPAKEILARAIYVIDKDQTVIYADITPEVSTEPPYDEALAAAKKLI